MKIKFTTEKPVNFEDFISQEWIGFDDNWDCCASIVHIDKDGDIETIQSGFSPAPPTTPLPHKGGSRRAWQTALSQSLYIQDGPCSFEFRGPQNGFTQETLSPFYRGYDSDWETFNTALVGEIAISSVEGTYGAFEGGDALKCYAEVKEKWVQSCSPFWMALVEGSLDVGDCEWAPRQCFSARLWKSRGQNQLCDVGDLPMPIEKIRMVQDLLKLLPEGSQRITHAVRAITDRYFFT